MWRAFATLCLVVVAATVTPGCTDSTKVSEGKAVAHADSRAHRAVDDDDVEHQEGEEAREAQFLTERRNDEVAVRVGHQIRAPLSQPRAEEAARGHAEEPANQLL